MLVQNPRGHYAFVRGIAPYSGGAVAHPGYEVEHAVFRRPLELKKGFEALAQHLAARRLPKQALCGMELRSPRPFSFQGFTDFNAGYVAVLKEWEILVEGGLNPVARTNVAPEVFPPAEPSLHGFSYIVPAPGAPRTFVVAGAGELPEGSLDPHEVIRRGETSPGALAEKARFVMGLMSGRLRELGAGWGEATAIDVYTVHDISPFLAPDLLRPAGHNEIVWQYSRPPIVSIEFEMDVRGVRRELRLG